MRNTNKSGFTLIEILVVILIFGVISSFVLSNIKEARDKARVAKARLEVKQLRIAIEMLASDTVEWPDHKNVGTIQSGQSGNEVWDLSLPSSGLAATDGLFGNWSGPYIPTIPLDPWGNNYFFDTDYDVDPGGSEKWAAVVGSFGPNGIGQNIYDDDNIYETIISE